MASEEKINRFVDPGELESIKDRDDGRTDPSGRYPKAEYTGVTSVNNIATGAKTKNVYLGGSVPDVNFDLEDEPASAYTHNQVKETASGHIIEYDDTFGRERIMLRHRSGSGVEMRADGSVIYSSTKNTIRVTAADEKVVVEGDGEIVYNGNLKMRVSGDFDIDVGGDFNVNVGGDAEKNIKGSYTKDVIENYTKRIIGNEADIVVKTRTATTLGDKNSSVKGNFEEIIEGKAEFVSKDELILTSQDGVVVSSPDTHIYGTALKVTGASGTMGGENIINYVKNIYATSGTYTAGITAPSFHGNLKGTADKAFEAQKSGTAGAIGASGSASAPSHTATDLTATTEPTASIMTEILEKTNLGIRIVDVDEFDDLKNAADRTVDYGGISKYDLTTGAARSKLRDPNNINNTTFIATLLSEGTISKNFISVVPPKTGRIVSEEKIPIRGTEGIGQQSAQTKLFT